jgi:hypothetical protein
MHPQQIVSHQQNGRALLRAALQFFEQLTGGDFVKVRRWLVEKQQGRLLGEHSRNMRTPLFATREATECSRGQLVNPKRCHRLLDGRFVVCDAPPQPLHELPNRGFVRQATQAHQFGHRDIWRQHWGLSGNG